MITKRKPEGLHIVLTLVLASVLTLLTLVLLFAFLDFSAQTSELGVAIVVFGAWLLVTYMVAPLFQEREFSREPERAP